MPVTFAGQNFELLKDADQLIMVNIDNTETDKFSLDPTICFNADIKYFLQKFNKINRNIADKKVSWLHKCQKFKNDNVVLVGPDKNQRINSYYLIDKINNISDAHHIFVNDAGSGNYIISQGLRLKPGQREITSGAFYSMGLALPMAIGAAYSYPEKQIIAIIGDGSIELNIQELRTLSLNNLNVKLFIINNGGYASIRKSQNDMVGGRYTDDQEVLNFECVSAAFGLRYRIFESYDQLDQGIPDVFKTNSPELIEVICDPDQEIIEPFKSLLKP